jgi:8-oxo-dGTP pyrophosphatase MutT (NUDIX family)
MPIDPFTAPSIPRLAATLLLVRDDPFEVLMVRRNSRATFASAQVFPGGGIDPDDRDDGWADLVDDFDDFDEDERALRIGAIRETWEETSILAAGGSLSTDVVPGVTFRELVATGGATLHLGALAPFGHWITPIVEARRFDTHFFLAPAPAHQLAISDGTETVGVEWVNPAEAVELAARGERAIVFPTLMNLARLAESLDSRSAMTFARARPRFTVNPVVETAPDDSRTITIPAEAGYAATTFTFGAPG